MGRGLLSRAAAVAGVASTLVILPHVSLAEPPQTKALDEIRSLIQASRYVDAEVSSRELLSQFGGEEATTLEAGLTLDLLVEALWRGGKAGNPETTRLAERAVAIKRAVAGPEAVTLAASLQNLSSVLLRRGEYDSAMQACRQALKIRESAQGKGHADVADTVTRLANIYRMKGELASALKLYDRALEITRRSLGEGHPKTAMILYNQASTLRETGDHEAASVAFDSALKTARTAYPGDDERVAVILMGLGNLRDESGRHSEAKALYEEALGIRRRLFGPRHIETGATLHNLGLACWHLGDYVQARALLEESLSIHRETAGGEGPAMAKTLNSLGILLAEMGELEPAIADHEEALRIQRATLPEAHHEIATTLHYLGEAQAALGHPREARDSLEQAVVLWEKQGADHYDLARTLAALGGVLAGQGELDLAKERLERALAIQTSSLSTTHPDVAEARDRLGGVLAHMGQKVAAREQYEQALRIRSKVLGEDHPLTGNTLYALATVQDSLGELTKAIDLALRAEGIIRQNVRLMIRSLPERQALAYASKRLPALDLALDTAWRTTGSSSTQRWSAWDALVRSRAQVLDEMAARHRTITTVTRRTADLIAAQQRLARLSITGLERQPPERLRRLLEEARANVDLAEKELVKATGRAGTVDTAQVGLAEVARELPQGSALVAYVLVASQASSAESSYAAFVLGPDKRHLALLHLASAKVIEERVSRWRTQVARAGARGESAGEDADERMAGEALRRAIWDPLLPHIGMAKKVFVVPDAALHLVSLAGLPSGTSEYVIEDGPTIHYLSTERDLVPAISEQKGKGLLALGGPAFDDVPSFSALVPAPRDGMDASTSQQASLSPFRGEGSACEGFRSLKFTGLPYSAKEAEQVTALWRAETTLTVAGGEALGLVGSEASESAFKRLAPGRRVVHVATHGFFLTGACPYAGSARRGIGMIAPADSSNAAHGNEENPLILSGLALAGANHRSAAGPEEDDGILTAEEIASMDLSGVEWAVLSACDTGVGEIRAGEGVFGLRRAFKTAGAGTLVMTLWQVEDEPAREWTTALYEGRLHQGLTTAEAVRQAGLRVLRGRRKAGLGTSAIHWAGFVAVGDWR